MTTGRRWIPPLLLVIVFTGAACTDQPDDTAAEPGPEILRPAVLIVDQECANAGTVAWEDEEWVLLEAGPQEWFHAGPIEGQIIVDSAGYKGIFRDHDGNEAPVAGRLDQFDDITVGQDAECLTGYLDG